MMSPIKNYNTVLIYSLLLVSLIFTGACTDSNSSVDSANKPINTAQNKQTVPVKDEVSELLETIRLPEIPEEAMWKEEVLGKTGDNRVPGPTDKKLTAVLKYTPENAAKIVALAEKNKKPEQVEISAESWFPEELTAQSQLSGNESLKGTAYGANDFLNIPYSTGKITRIEGTDYFILELLAN